MRKRLSSHLRTGPRFSFWPTALIGIVVIKAVLSLDVNPGSFALSYSGISYFLLLFLAASFAIRNGIQNTLERRPFWVYLTIAYGLWALHQGITLYYQLGRHIDAPDSSIADPALFLHIVPLMAAVATLRHQNVSDRNPYRAILNSLLLLFFWSFLYGYLVFPYQYFPNATSYALRFDILYLLENLALVLFVGISILRVQAPWKSIYLHLFGASTLYALSSAVANLAIDSTGYVNGKLYGLGLTASVCWFVWIPLCARQVKGEATAVRPNTSPSQRGSVWATLVVVMVSIPIIWELFQRNEDTGLRTLRLLVAIVAILCLASAAYVKEYLARRELDFQNEANAALRESEERQAYLLKLSDALRPLSDPIEIQETASRLLGEQLQTDRAFYSEIDEARGPKVVERDFVRNGAPSSAGAYPLEAWAWIERSTQKGEPVVIENVRTSPLIPDADRAVILSALRVADVEPRVWKPAEIELVRETAERTWVAVERARAEGALRESEERFRLFLENVREYALVQLDTELRITSWNPGAERIFGYTSKEALGQPFALLLSPEECADHIPCMQISILEKSGRNEDARWLIHKDGTRIWTRWVTEPIRNKDGQITGLAKVLRDETERLRTETSLRQSENLAIVGRMASSIAHEINNPLEAVTNLIYLARSRDVSPEVSEFLEQAELELARVSQVTLATLHFHRQTTEPQVVDIEEILESVLVLHKGRLKSNQIATERRYSRHPSIICQVNEIRQVLANLIGNSIDAMKNMDARRLIVRVRTAVDPATKEEGVRVMIADSGMGIRESAAKHVFEPFFTTKAATGTGLGLWISAEAVKKHQGTLQFRSRSAGPFRGTVFSLHLGSGEQLRKAGNSHSSAVDLSMG